MSWPLSYCTLDKSPFFGFPETLVEQAKAAANAGFPYLTPDIFSLRTFVAGGGSLDALGADLAAVGIDVFDISGITISEDADASLAEAGESARFAAGIGAQWVQTRVPVVTDAVIDTYRRCAEAVATSGCGVALEFSPFTDVNSLDRARDLLHAVRDAAPVQGICVDSWHLDRGGDGWGALDRLPLDELAYVQLDDALPASSDLRADTLNRRALPGDGELDLAGFLAAFRAKGYTGVLSVEVLSAELRTLDIDDYARRCFASAKTIAG